MNVLSIDYDYFQKVKKSDLLSYPDGIDLPNDLSKIIWDTKYEFNNNLKEIQNDYGKIQIVLDSIIANPNAKYFISETHKDAYKFILDNKKNDNEVILYNLDMHHDCFNHNQKLDCGNWIGHLRDKCNLTLKWFYNPITPEMYNLDKELLDLMNNDLCKIKDVKFDLIFLCKSPNWVPPHLDEDFQMIANIIINTRKENPIL